MKEFWSLKKSKQDTKHQEILENLKQNLELKLEQKERKIFQGKSTRNLFLKDVYLEINGEKIAAIQNYSVNVLQDLHHVKSFCQKRPVQTLKYSNVFKVTLSKLKLVNAVDLVDFFELEDFNLSIVSPEYRLMFDHCYWTSMSELIVKSGTNSCSESNIIESLDVFATTKIKLINQDI